MAIVYGVSKKSLMCGEGLYYAHVKTTGVVGADDLCRLIAQYCQLKVPVLQASLMAFSEVMAEQLAAGKIVDLGELGRFQVSCSSEGVVRPDSFCATRHIKSARIVYRPGKGLKQRMKTLDYRRG